MFTIYVTQGKRFWGWYVKRNNEVIGESFLARRSKESAQRAAERCARKTEKRGVPGRVSYTYSPKTDARRETDGIFSRPMPPPTRDTGASETRRKRR